MIKDEAAPVLASTTFESDVSNGNGKIFPPGCEEGGEWGKVKYRGAKTGVAACAGCFVFMLPGLLIAAFPLDKKRAYNVDNVLYDARGIRIDVSTKKFKAVHA